MKIPRFESLGAFLPDTVLTTRDLMARMANPQPIDVERITGIVERRVLQDHEGSLTAAVGAVRDALSRSRYAAADIDVLISCSISRTAHAPDRAYFDPPMSVLVKREVGLTSALHFDVSNACAGMMTGLLLLTDMIKAGVVQTGIVVSGENISSIAMTAAAEISEPWDPQFGSLTVGDSGAAVVVDGRGDARDRIDDVELTTCAEYARLCIGKPSTKTAKYALYTDNPAMHKKERLMMWPHFHSAHLKRRGMSFAEEAFDYVIQHQVGLPFVEKLARIGAEAFGAEMPPSINSAARFANTATTSHFIALYDHLRRHSLQPQTKILFVPAASGLITGWVSATLSSLAV